MYIQRWRKTFTVLLIVVAALGCGLLGMMHDRVERVTKQLAPADEILPDENVVTRVINQFLEKKGQVSFRLHVVEDGKITANMTGTFRQQQWKTRKERQSLQLSGRNEHIREIKKGEKQASIKDPLQGLVSPRDHLRQLQAAHYRPIYAAENRSAAATSAVQLSLTAEQIVNTLKSILGDTFTSENVLQQLAHNVEIRYVLVYDKKNFDLKQLKMEIRHKDASIRGLTYLFEETSE